MQGFKSFGDRTELNFDQQIVGVVGPNGCGKSNIVDAIRWAMGEQSAKGLRGKEMSDVIFSGTPSRKAGGFAEVSLTFDNSEKQAPAPYTDCAEIMVTRRLYRTGESEYLINNVSARLKDINDLFLGTGSSAKAYSIVAQGKVDQIVLAKPEDRRMLIEEAAGIAKYKVRKQSAERKMEATQKNLERVQDILKELERNARHLERQVERAEKFRELQRELRQLDERVIAAKIKKIDKDASENQDELEKRKEALEGVTAKLNTLESELEKNRLESLNQEKITNTDYEQLMQKKEQSSELTTEAELATQKIQLLRNQIAEREKDIERIAGKFDSQEEARRKLQTEVAEFEAKLNARDEQANQLKAKLEAAAARVQQKEAEIQNLRSQLEEVKTRVAKEAQKLEHLQAERVETELERAASERQLEEVSLRKTEAEAQLQDLLAKAQNLKGLIQKNRESSDSCGRKQEEATKRQQELSSQKFEIEKELSAIDSRLKAIATLEEHQAGYEAGAIEFKEKLSQPWLMDQVEFKPDYQGLGEILLYHLGQHFMVEPQDYSEVERRWTNIVVGGTSNTESERTCLELVSNDLPENLQRLFASIALVDQLSQQPQVGAEMDLEGNFRSQLSSGFYLESRGKITREESPYGRKQEKSEILQKQKSLELAKTQIDEQLQELKQLMVELKDKSERLKAEEVSLENEQQILVDALNKLREQIVRIDSEKDRFEQDMQKHDRRLEVLLQDIQSFEQPESADSLEGQLKKQLDELAGLQSEKSGFDSQWVEFRIETGALKERYERLKQQIVDVDMTQSEYSHNQGVFKEDIQHWTKEIEELQSRSTETQARKANISEEIKSLEFNLAKAREALQKLHAELEEKESSRKSLQSEKETANESVKALEMQRQELKFQVEELSQLISERYHQSLEEALEQVNPEEIAELEEDAAKLDKAEQEVARLRDRLSKFGDVNLVALQEYEEIKQRLDFMNRQRDDLVNTLDKLQSIIERINNITQFRFRETFKAINHNFQTLFPKLFGGGRAYMSLTNENDLLTSGVEIFAEPPGKKVQAMSLLSGGEKAMTSISLIFSLFAYRPSSFCILDEVDAPLDDINTRRYNDIIREMADLSHFIVITHNKRTMEVAQTLYGVTMQDAGVSRIVGVNLQEARAFTSTKENEAEAS